MKRNLREEIEQALAGGAPARVPFSFYDLLVPAGVDLAPLHARGLANCARRSVSRLVCDGVDVREVTEADGSIRKIFTTPVGSVSTCRKPVVVGEAPLRPSTYLAGAALFFLALTGQALGQARSIPMTNPDFEQGPIGWEFVGKTGNCTVTDTVAAHGKHSLQILSTATENVKVQSEPIASKGPMLLELHGRFLARWGYHLSLRLEQLDAGGQLVTNAPPFTLGPFGLNGVWEELIGYRGVGPVQLTEQTTHVRIVLEGKPAQSKPMEVYFDDFQIFDLGVTATNQQPVDVAAQLRQVTGRRARIAWTRGSRDDGGVLMGVDTENGSERVIVDASMKCVNPCLTADGNRIVFTGSEQTAYVVDWTGKNLRPLLKGRQHYVMGVWRDPQTSFDWVYLGDNFALEAVAELKAAGNAASDDSALSIYRYRLDDISIRELVWNKAAANRRVQVGPDGMKLAGEFPWPNCGVATLPNVGWQLYGQGCNPNLAPDGSGRFFYMLGNHRQLRVLPVGAVIHVNTMAGNLKDPKRAVWRPRWSNDVRFFTINSCDLAPGSDIYLGEFNEDFSGMKQWVRITESKEYDADGIAWIEPPPARKE